MERLRKTDVAPKKKDLLAKIGDLTMQMEAYKIARDYLGLGKPQPDAES